jgi:glucose-6-phosphate isomerase
MSLRATDRAFFNTEAVLAVGEPMIADLKERARRSPSRRFRLCLHHSPDELVQEMIVVHCRDNYSRPHSHPHAASSALLIEGELTVFLFDDSGTVTETITLGPRGSGKPFTLRLGPNLWHMPVCRSPQVVFYETMTGPFRRDEVNVWAPWSPAEDDVDGIAAYLRALGVAF